MKKLYVGDISDESVTMVQCPRCADGIDPDAFVTTTTFCCGQSTDCGGNKCNGPEEIQDVEPQPCTMCGGNKFIEATEALAYCLEV